MIAPTNNTIAEISIIQNPMPRWRPLSVLDEEREHHDRGLESEREVHLVPAHAERPGRQLHAGAEVGERDLTGHRDAAEHDDRRDPEEAGAPGVERLAATEVPTLKPGTV